MPTWLRAIAAAAILVGGVFTAATLEDGIAVPVSKLLDYSVIESPVFSIELRRDELHVDGFTSSAAHERALSQFVAENFAAHEADLNFRPLVIPPISWTLVTTRLLDAISALESANAVVTKQLIEIRGITADQATWHNKLNALRAVTRPGVIIDVDILAINASLPISELCIRAFSQINKGSVEFKQSSTEILTSSYAFLDALTEIAYDCVGMELAITGHSDSSGNETANKKLSLARAQAVADYLIRNGLTSAQLTVVGAGSLFPVADNSSARGRSLNRRIEFEMRAGN